MSVSSAMEHGGSQSTSHPHSQNQPLVQPKVPATTAAGVKPDVMSLDMSTQGPPPNQVAPVERPPPSQVATVPTNYGIPQRPRPSMPPIPSASATVSPAVSIATATQMQASRFPTSQPPLNLALPVAQGSASSVNIVRPPVRLPQHSTIPQQSMHPIQQQIQVSRSPYSHDFNFLT